MVVATDPPAPRPIVRIVGTSHVARQSAAAIRRAADEFQPTIVAIELDRRRLQSLRERLPGEKPVRPPFSMVRQVGATGYLFLLVASWLQRKIGDVLNVDPGVDMLAAVEVARERGLRLALVDQDVTVTLRRLSAAFTWREKLRVVRDILLAPFSREKIAIRLDRVPAQEVIRRLLAELRKRYPSLYQVLIVERNVHMCARIDALARADTGARILLVIGAGHEEDLRERLRAVGTVTVS